MAKAESTGVGFQFHNPIGSYAQGALEDSKTRRREDAFLQRWKIVVSQGPNHLITLPTRQVLLHSTAPEITKWHHVAEVYSARDANSVVRVT